MLRFKGNHCLSKENTLGIKAWLGNILDSVIYWFCSMVMDDATDHNTQLVHERNSIFKPTQHVIHDPRGLKKSTQWCSDVDIDKLPKQALTECITIQ